VETWARKYFLSQVKNHSENKGIMREIFPFTPKVVMTMSFPNCPQCNSTYVYEDQTMLICPECAHEWNPNEVVVDEDVLIIKDMSGKLLQEGDKVTLAKDLKVKGSSQVLKIGTKATIKRLVDGDHDIDCKVDGAGDMMLKSKFVKKASA
jgi:protein PhnA